MTKLPKDCRLQEHGDSWPIKGSEQGLKLLPVFGIKAAKIDKVESWHPTDSWLILSTSQWSSWFGLDAHSVLLISNDQEVGVT